MQDKTIGIIMVLKTTYGTMKDYKEEVLKFLCDYSKTDYDYMSKLDDKVKYNYTIHHFIQAFVDYIGSADDPKTEVSKFFGFKYNADQSVDDIEAIIKVFIQSLVIHKSDSNDEVEYVNGFRDFKYKDLELSLDTRCFENNHRVNNIKVDEV